MTVQVTNVIMDLLLLAITNVCAKKMEHGMGLIPHVNTKNTIMVIVIPDMVIVIPDMVVLNMAEVMITRKTISRLKIQYMYEHYHNNFSLQYFSSRS